MPYSASPWLKKIFENRHDEMLQNGLISIFHATFSFTMVEENFWNLTWWNALEWLDRHISCYIHSFTFSEPGILLTAMAMHTRGHIPFGQENSYFFVMTIFIVKKWPLFEPSVPIAELIFRADFFFCWHGNKVY